MIWSKTVLVRSRLDIFVDSEQNQRLQYFRGWAEKRDRMINEDFHIAGICSLFVVADNFDSNISSPNGIKAAHALTIIIS